MVTTIKLMSLCTTPPFLYFFIEMFYLVPNTYVLHIYSHGKFQHLSILLGQSQSLVQYHCPLFVWLEVNFFNFFRVADTSNSYPPCGSISYPNLWFFMKNLEIISKYCNHEELVRCIMHHFYAYHEWNTNKIISDLFFTRSKFIKVRCLLVSYVIQNMMHSCLFVCWVPTSVHQLFLPTRYRGYYLHILST